MDAVPLSVLIGRAEFLERGKNPIATAHNPARLRPKPNRLALTTLNISDEDEIEEELAILAVDSTFAREKPQRGLTCYVCYNTGYPWLVCPYIRHLSSEE